ncbi:MAG: hypothetical protein HOH38_11305 [Nitrospinaceae bacterium]|nr:hypothetical protein [Nitrospinaceae bacterium]
MSLLESSLVLLSVLLMLSGGLAAYYWQEIKGGLCLWQSMQTRRKQFELRTEAKISSQENQAVAVVLETCFRYQKEKQICEEGFLSNTLELVSQIASIYYPAEQEPMYQARIGSLLSELLTMNRQILQMLDIPDLEKLTQFRLREVAPASQTDAQTSNPNLLTKFLTQRIRARVVRALWVQWNLFVGEAAIKVYGEHQADEILESEALLAELDRLQDESDLLLPEEVREIVKKSKKNILYAGKPLPWEQVKTLYTLLAKDIARVWHPQSSMPLSEVRVYDLLRSLAGYLEWAGNLNRKPVLNKMLGLRLSHVKGAKEGLNIMPDNKLFDWMQKYQVGRAAKWSRAIFKAVQKKQPAILFRDVVLGLAKEGGKRWLLLIMHDKIAEETNKLYKTR